MLRDAKKFDCVTITGLYVQPDCRRLQVVVKMWVIEWWTLNSVAYPRRGSESPPGRRHQRPSRTKPH